MHSYSNIWNIYKSRKFKNMVVFTCSTTCKIVTAKRTIAPPKHKKMYHTFSSVETLIHPSVCACKSSWLPLLQHRWLAGEKLAFQYQLALRPTSHAGEERLLTATAFQICTCYLRFGYYRDLKWKNNVKACYGMFNYRNI